MKVGILTFHRTTNYGATLQAYAFWKTIQNQGHDVELIDYLPDQLRRSYINHLYKNKFFIFNALKDLNMRKFIDSKMEFSRKQYRNSSEITKKLSKSYDLVICGSDEIWNFDSPHTGFDSVYFLDFIVQGTARKLSYATSFGSIKSLGNEKNRVYKLLKSFDAISVRDRISLAFVTDECGLSATKTVDPTLLATYDDIAISPNTDRDYILVYGGLSQKEQIYVKKLADYRGLDLISVGYPCRTARVNHLSIGPGEWLGYFSQASYIFTNFYHGVLFSVIFNKPFNCFYRDDKSQKVIDFLSDVGLEDRLIWDIAQVNQPQMFSELLFDRTKLQYMIQASKTFIHHHLNRSPLPKLFVNN